MGAGPQQEGQPRLKTVLYTLAECVRRVAVMIGFVMPRTPERIFEQLGVTDDALKTWDSVCKPFAVLPEGLTVHKGAALFPRLDIQKEIERDAPAEEPKKEEKKPAAKPEKKAEKKHETPDFPAEIAFDDFCKCKMQVARVLSCEKVEKSNKLLQFRLSFGKDGSRSVVLCGQHVLGEELTSRQVNDHVSTIAAIPEVRALLVERQREYNRREPVVMEGRDIGTVVFPETPFKYFVTASEEVRAARRAAEGLTDSIAERDRKDSSRATAPLAQAPDALLVDTSDMTIDQVVRFITDNIQQKLSSR